MWVLQDTMFRFLTPRLLRDAAKVMQNYAFAKKTYFTDGEGYPLSVRKVFPGIGETAVNPTGCCAIGAMLLAMNTGEEEHFLNEVMTKGGDLADETHDLLTTYCQTFRLYNFPRHLPDFNDDQEDQRPVIALLESLADFMETHSREV